MRDLTEKSFRRLLLLFGLIFLIFLSFLAKLCSIQILDHQRFSRLAAGQREITLKQHEIKGFFYDRNGEVMRGPVRKWFLLVDKNSGGAGEVYRQLEDLLPSTFKVEAAAKRPEQPWLYSKPLTTTEIEGIIKLRSPELRIISYQLGRDPQSQLAWHVLGQISETTSYSGLELSFDSILRNQEPASVFRVTDGFHQTIPGIGIRNKSYPNKAGIVLTLDKKIQQLVEEVMTENKLSGAVVILDVSSGAILAMASRPLIDLDNIKASFGRTDYPFLNRAVTAYQPGSIFKLIIVAAGIDRGLVQPGEVFKDEGAFKLGDERWACTTSDGKGHGEITLTEAFAYSCNPIFINLALRLRPELILNYAEKFGWGRPCNIGLRDESWGEIPSGFGLSLGEQANIALGQQLISATPLQVASLIQTIANDGVRIEPFIVLGRVDEYGNAFGIESGKQERVISAESARELQQMLLAVTQYGTGKEANPAMGAAGKTGTAQVGEDEKLPDLAWFAGYAPLKKPKYAAVIFCEKGVSGGVTAAPIFKKIMDKITMVTD